MSQDKSRMKPISAQLQNPDFQCITCSDEAVRVRVLSVDQEAAMAKVELAEGSATEEVDISLVDAVSPGDLLLSHGGVALARLGGE